MYFEAYAQTGDECCQQVRLGIIRRTFDHTNRCERRYTLRFSENGTETRYEGKDGYVADLRPRGEGWVPRWRGS
jgi:hypothetical protein